MSEARIRRMEHRAQTAERRAIAAEAERDSFARLLAAVKLSNVKLQTRNVELFQALRRGDFKCSECWDMEDE